MTEEELKAALPEHLARCCVPPEITRHLVEASAPTPAIAEVRAWLDTDTLTIVLLGGTGCGKSHAGCWALTENKISYRVFLRVPGDLPPDLRWDGGYFCDMQRDLAGPHGSYEDRNAIIQRATNTSLLILDEVGIEKGDGEQALFTILSDRIGAKRRSVITSNLNEAAFRERYRGRIISRILGSGRISTVHGPDLRRVS